MNIKELINFIFKIIIQVVTTYIMLLVLPNIISTSTIMNYKDIILTNIKNIFNHVNVFLGL